MKRIKRISFITLTYVFGFIVGALFSAFIEGIFNMIKNPDVECTPTKSHQQIIDKLDNISIKEYKCYFDDNTGFGLTNIPCPDDLLIKDK